MNKFLASPFSNTWFLCHIMSDPINAPMAKTRQTILLADDDEDDVYLFKDAIVELTGAYEVATASNGIECMHLLQKGFIPDILFLDINMPMKNGFECLQEIRKDEKLKSLAVVVLSTAINKRVIDQAYTLGADLYISKAIDYKEFKSSLLYALSENFLIRQKNKRSRRRELGEN